MGMLHGVDHVGPWFLGSNPPAARDVDVDAIGSDQVGIKANDFIGLGDPSTTFLEP